jgi:hypothetical protein
MLPAVIRFAVAVAVIAAVCGNAEQALAANKAKTKSSPASKPPSKGTSGSSSSSGSGPGSKPNTCAGNKAKLECVAGDPCDDSLLKIFNEPYPANPDNHPIAEWRRQRAQARPAVPDEVCTACKIPMQQVLKVGEVMRRVSPFSLRIKPSCIEASMSTIDRTFMEINSGASSYCWPVEDKKHPGTLIQKCHTPAYVCRTADQAKPELKFEKTPCVTKEMAEYVGWITDQAISCLSPENDPLNRALLFDMFNNESRFAFMIRTRNGIGLPQLIPDTEIEMRNPERGYKVLEAAKEILTAKKTGNMAKLNACKAFEEVFKRTPSQLPPPTPKEGKKGSDKEKPKPPPPFNTCSLVQPGIGVAKAALLGVGNYLHVRDNYKWYQKEYSTPRPKTVEYDFSATGLVRSSGLDPDTQPETRDLRDLITLAQYSAAGPSAGAIQFNTMKSKIDCATPKKHCTSKNLFNNFFYWMKEYYKLKGKPMYYDDINRSRAAIAGPLGYKGKNLEETIEKIKEYPCTEPY